MSRGIASDSLRNRLGVLLGLFFVALAIPSAVLTWQAYSRLQWETFHQYQLLAEQLLGRVDLRMREMVAREEARAIGDYRFLVVEGAPVADPSARSPLSRFPVDSDIPGLLGHFQIDADGRFTTPLLPDAAQTKTRPHDINLDELRKRQAVRERLLKILSREGLLASAGNGRRDIDSGKPPALRMRLAKAKELDTTPRRADDAEPDAAAAASASRSMPANDEAPIEPQEQRLGQAAFNQLSDEFARLRKSEKPTTAIGNIGRVAEIKLDQAFDKDSKMAPERRALPRFTERIEYSAAPSEAESAEPQAASRTADEGENVENRAPPALVRIFESEVDPFAFGLVGNEHFVLYRKIWREGQRLIQGAVIDRATWLRETIEAPFRETTLAGMSRLGIVFEEEILSALGGQQGRSYLSSTEELSGTLLYRGRMSSPLDELELIFSVTRMPSGSAGGLVIWVAIILALVLSGGLFLVYRLGIQQIELNRQQRDFVSAVSHELKTPLTSIRMYSEMLREGWADEARRKSYYDYIHDESERLSRLISNVLQLARMSRDDLKVDPQPIVISALLDVIRQKVATQVQQAGFALKIECAEGAGTQKILIDADAFSQIMINLVDNAIKFSARSDHQRVDITVKETGYGLIEVAVRDYGPGIPDDQMKKIFRLFYRSENELTRETVGTGIGLALVHRLVVAMGGEVDVVNREPGAEFRLRFSVLAA